ncbi:MAG: hypothetical protein ACRCYR_14675 [Phycicoccus sp.]
MARLARWMRARGRRRPGPTAGLLREHDAEIGVRVRYAGPRTDIDVDAWHAENNRILEYGHPGVIAAIHGPGTWHVVVEFLGLENQGISLGTGFDPENGVYPGLMRPTDEEWDEAARSGWWAEGAATGD